MKKLLSLALCVCMVISCFATMLVSVSAQNTVTTIPNAGDVPTLTKNERIYYETFESSSLDTLTNENLMSTLSWTGTLGESDALSIVEENGNHAVSFSVNSSRLDTVCMLEDDRLYGGNYIVEYTARILSATSGGRGFGLTSSRDTAQEMGWRYIIKDRGDIDHALKFVSNHTFAEGGASLDICKDDTSGLVGEGNSITGETIRIRTVVDADFGVSVWLVNGNDATLISATSAENSALWKEDCTKYLGNKLYFHVLSGLSVAYDDIEVWSTTKGKDDSVPQYIGFQTSTPESNLHDVRFIAGINSLDAASMGYEIAIQFVRDGQNISVTRKVYCEYVYTAITSDFGEDSVAASEYGYNYMMALNINNVPSNTPVTFTIAPFAATTENGVETVKWSPSRTLVLGTAPTQNDLINQLPAYTGSGRYYKTTSEFTTGQYRIHYRYANLSSYNTYMNTLASNGFTLYASNEIDGNVFNTYYNENLFVHAYFISTKKTITILVTDRQSAALYPKTPTMDGYVTKPTLTMLDLQYTKTANNGMGFIYTLEDGSFVIIDGGYEVEAETVYNFLQQNNKRADGEILIRAWIVTHPDGDHYRCFNEFTTKYANRVTLEYFVAQFEQYHITGSYASIIANIYQNAAKYEGCKTITPLAGQVMYFGTLKVEFLYTAEMYEKFAGSTLTGTNESSLVFKATLADTVGAEETTVLFAADAVGKTLNLLTTYYSAALKSDVLQLPHHGLNGTQDLYNKVKPNTVLFCTSTAYATERMDGSTYENQNQIGWLLSQSWAPEVLIADGTDKVITIVTITSPSEGDFEAGEKDSIDFDTIFGIN